MDAAVQLQLDRVETALTTLIESITSYNPSPASAQDLLDADTELAATLAELSAHQATHARLVSLQRTADTLDAQIKDTLSLLATTRSDLLNLTFTVPPSHQTNNANDETAHITPVDYIELLNFAQRISRFTVPPTQHPSLPPPIPSTKTVETSAALNAAGATTPAPSAIVPKLAPDSPAPSAAPTPRANGQAPLTPGSTGPHGPAGTTTVEEPGSGGGVAVKREGTDDPAIQAWLSPPAHGLGFVPWPDENRIRGGALGVVQSLVERGVDPATVQDAVVEGDAGGGAGKGEDVEMQEEQQQQEQRQQEEEGDKLREVSGGQKQSVRQQVAAVPTSNVFDDMELYNPDEG